MIRIFSGEVSRNPHYSTPVLLVVKSAVQRTGKADSRGKGTKIIALADDHSLPLAVRIESASPHESQLVEGVLGQSFHEAAYRTAMPPWDRRWSRAGGDESRHQRNRKQDRRDGNKRERISGMNVIQNASQVARHAE